MASTEATSSDTPVANQLVQQPPIDDTSSTKPVEMSQLASQQPLSSSNTAASSASEPQHAQDATQSDSQAAEPQISTANNMASTQTESASPTTPSTSTFPSMMRKESVPIGPAQDNPVVSADPASGPMVLITLLLITGARHPYKIDEKYLRRRNVIADGAEADPFGISVYTMKELIWRDWREEWEARPTSPSYIRLIHFGRLLDDKTLLRDCRFNPSVSNVVHMTVKPQDIIDEEENAKASKGSTHRDQDEPERQGGICRCVIL